MKKDEKSRGELGGVGGDVKSQRKRKNMNLIYVSKCHASPKNSSAPHFMYLRHFLADGNS